jgi:hypothetical protein
LDVASTPSARPVKHMKYLLLATMIAACAVTALSQSKPNAVIQDQLRVSGANASVNFDPNSKVTTLKGVAENFSDSDTKRVGAKAMNFAVGAIYAGDKLERSVDQITLSFWIMSGGKPRFGEDHSLVTVGTERTDLGAGRYTFRRDGMEYLNFSLSRVQIAKLSVATTWVIGGKQFTPTSSQKKLVRDILAATQTD